MRPSFESTPRPVWRASDRLQVGEASLIGITPSEARALRRLDGSVTSEILDHSAPRVSFAASLLRLVGVVEDGPTEAARPGSIRVEGHGELADAARSLIGPHHPGPNEAASVLLASTGSGEPMRMRADTLSSMRVRHLLAYLPTEVSTARSVVVGPLVEPGTGNSCLRCQHLVRCDRDPSWPVIAAQLATPASREVSTLTTRVLAVVGAALAIEQLLCPPGTASTTNGAIEWVEGALRRRSWPRHPECPMH